MLFVCSGKLAKESAQVPCMGKEAHYCEVEMRQLQPEACPLKGAATADLLTPCP